ncbi:hypothetical protein Peur_029164 [Populus x canadensis]
MSIHLLMPSLSRYISQEASDSRHLLSLPLSALLSNGKLKLTLAFQKPKYLDLPPREKQAREDLPCLKSVTAHVEELLESLTDLFSVQIHNNEPV